MPPRTVTAGDVAVLQAQFGSRFAVNSSDPFWRMLGPPGVPVDSVLAFHLDFGRTVADVSLNAIANLGYAGCRFGAQQYSGDSRVIGLRQNKDEETGVVCFHSTGVDQRGEMGLGCCRWVMVRKRDPDTPAPEPVVPTLPDHVPNSELRCPFTLAPGNGLANALAITAIHGGRHAAPSFAGDTIYAWSEVLSRDALPGRSDIGVLRLRTVATKDRAGADFPGHDPAVSDPAVVLDLAYSVLMPRRH